MTRRRVTVLKKQRVLAGSRRRGKVAHWQEVRCACGHNHFGIGSGKYFFLYLTWDHHLVHRPAPVDPTQGEPIAVVFTSLNVILSPPSMNCPTLLIFLLLPLRAGYPFHSYSSTSSSRSAVGFHTLLTSAPFVCDVRSLDPRFFLIETLVTSALFQRPRVDAKGY